MICKTEYNELFDKFMLSIKDEIYKRFLDYLNNNIEKRENEIEMVTKVIEEPIKKKGRGRPKKNLDSSDVKEEPKKKSRGRPKKKDNFEQLIVTVVDDTDDENDSKKRGRPVSEERKIIRDVFEESNNNNNNDENSDDEGIDVVRIEIEDKIYLRDGTNNLYNMCDQEFVGVYDEINGTIIVS